MNIFSPRLLKEQNVLGSVFPHSRDSPGISQALWQTIRDLREGLVDPSTALSAHKGRYV